MRPFRLGEREERPQGWVFPEIKKEPVSSGLAFVRSFRLGKRERRPTGRAFPGMKKEPARRLAPGMALFVSQPVTVREVMWGLAPSYQ